MGERCHARRDWQAKSRTNVIGALYASTLISVGLFQGSLNAAAFHAWVEQSLVHHLPPASVVVMDNASFHKRADTQQCLERAGHTLVFLPPYSPDLNPIEHKWAQAKAYRRRERCSVEELFTHYL